MNLAKENLLLRRGNAALTAVIGDMKSGAYDFTQNGKCSNCGQCCSNILPLSKSEISQIHEYIAENNIKEQSNLYPMRGQILDMICPFRDNKNKCCTIYKIRPMICKCFKCDNTKNKIYADKKMFERTRFIVNMRKEFFSLQE